MNNNYGSVTFDGKTYNLTQDAYINNYLDRACYFASATGDDGETYRVRWEIRDEFEQMSNDDESEACDWDNPADVRKL
jgi:hypothetical protein